MESPKDWNGCNNCKWLDIKSLSCVAFPNGIPMMFLSGVIPHLETIEWQSGGVVWEPRKSRNSYLSKSDTDQSEQFGAKADGTFDQEVADLLLQVILPVNKQIDYIADYDFVSDDETIVLGMDDKKEVLFTINGKTGTISSKIRNADQLIKQKMFGAFNADVADSLLDTIRFINNEIVELVDYSIEADGTFLAVAQDVDHAEYCYMIDAETGYAEEMAGDG